MRCILLHYSESSSNSHSPGSEADDEGEESCVESSGMKRGVPLWEHGHDPDMSLHEADQVIGVSEQSLSLMSGRPGNIGFIIQ